MSIRIYEIKTQTPDTKPGHFYDSYRVAAESFGEAIAKVKAKLFKPSKESIQQVMLVAQEDAE